MELKYGILMSTLMAVWFTVDIHLLNTELNPDTCTCDVYCMQRYQLFVLYVIKIQCSAVITRSIFSQIFTKDTT